MAFNQLTAIGNLTRDIELRCLPSGNPVAQSAIATSYKYKSSSGEQKTETCFLDFEIFGKGAEVLNQYCRKGSKLHLVGRLVFEQWEDQNQNKRSRHKLRVDQFNFLDNKGDGQQQNNNYQQHQEQGGNGQQQKQVPVEYDIDEDEIPF